MRITFGIIKIFLSVLFLMFLVLYSFSQDSTKTLHALRITSDPKIDGLLDEDVWKNAQGVTDFIQNYPQEGKTVNQKTEVKILYDNFAIYIGAMMYDTSPDSILHELGSRDDERDLNADYFRFVIDPYLTFQDAYDFGVYSSGVQRDSRFSDPTYNGVWQSAVKILRNGWSMEMKIPYSAIRFPNKKNQRWGLQLTRGIRRAREFDQWALTPSGKANPQKYWGILEGISDIKPPLRLSTTPYLSTYVASAPDYNADGSYKYSNSLSYNAGADIKYGLDERFTLETTLLPDFGQVQSDNKVKNLSYREVTYTEYRPFFQEGIDLFTKNNLFYSRRIGETPAYYASIPDSLKSGETIEKNPTQAKLINAIKLSGRTNHGTGIGFLNSTTDDTYASIKDSVGHTRKILTEPLTNYNVMVIDQQLKNSSDVYLINTDVIRKGNNNRNANVSGTGYTFQNKKNAWATDGSASVSQIFKDSIGLRDLTGYHYFMDIRKASGIFQFTLGHDVMNNTYNSSDMGYQSINNYSSFNGLVMLNMYKSWKFILRSYNNLNINYSYNFITGLPTNTAINLNLYALTKKQWGIWCGAATSPISGFDYYEPRVVGKYVRTDQWYYIYAGFSTDYQKTFATDINVNTGNFFKQNIDGFPQMQGYGFDIKPRLRANDQLSFLYDFNYNFDPWNPGFSNFDVNGEPVFGARILHTYIQTLTAKYIFKNDLSFSLNIRHYWDTGKYRYYYSLLDNGLLASYPTYSGNDNFSYNAFNIDAVFSWQFAPGSVLSFAYKNAIETNNTSIPQSFSDNFLSTIQSPQINSISLKVLYYLDYQILKRNRNVIS